MKIFLRNPVWLLIMLGVCSILTLSIKLNYAGYVIGSDGLGYYAHLRSAIIDGDLLYANEFLEYNQFSHGVPDPYKRTTPNHVPNAYHIGPAILWIPFFLLAHALTILSNYLGITLMPDGYSILYQIFIGLGSIIYGLMGLIFVYQILLRFFSRNETILATVFIASATNVIYYITNEPTMSHSMSLFAVSMFAYIWVRDIGNRTKKSIILLGLAAGLMTLIRPQNILFLLLPMIEWLGLLKKGKLDCFTSLRERILEVGLFGVVYLIMLVPQFIVWKVLYDRFIVYSYTGATFNFAHPHLLDSLFSARHGLIYWTPIILLALIGVIIFILKQPKIGSIFFLTFVLQWYLNASWNCWWFGHSFGGRAYINCSFVFAIGLAMLFTVLKRKARLVLLLLVLMLTGWNLLFIAQFALSKLPHDQPVELHQVLVNLVHTINVFWKFLQGMI